MPSPKERKFWLAVFFAGIFILGFIYAKRPARVPEQRLSQPIARGSIIESVYGIGTVEANKRFQLKPGTTATIRDLFVKEGDAVAAGQKLVELERGVIFSAPFNGTVVSLPAKVGENVFPQTTVLELVDLLDRYITVSLEQRAAMRVRTGQKARLSFETLRETAFDGIVESAYSHENSFLVRIGVAGLPPEILPGMTADVAIGISEHRNALLIPVAAIDNGVVLVQRGLGRPIEAPIKTGLVDGAVAEVASGELKEGDRLILPKSTRP